MHPQSTIPPVITAQTPAIVFAFGRSDSPLFYWVGHTHLAPDVVLTWRVEQAKANALFIRPALRDALLDVLASYATPTLAVLVDGLTMGEASPLVWQKAEQLHAIGHPLRNAGFNGVLGEEETEDERIEVCILTALGNHEWHTKEELHKALGLPGGQKPFGDVRIKNALERLAQRRTIMAEPIEIAGRLRGRFRYPQPMDFSGLKIR